MKNFLTPLVLSIGLLLILSSPVIAAEKMWIINQKSKLLGDIVLFVSNDSLKLVRTGLGSSIVVKAGDSKISVFNLEARVCSFVTIRQFQTSEDSRLAMLQGYLEAIPMVRVTKKGNHAISSLKTNYFHYEKKQASNRATSKTENRLMNMNQFKVKKADLWTASSIAVNPSFQKVIHAVYKLPKVKGIPLAMKTLDDTGAITMQLVTRRAIQKPYNKLAFALPKNMRKVEDYAQVLHSSRNLSRVVDYFDLMHDSGLGK